MCIRDSATSLMPPEVGIIYGWVDVGSVSYTHLDVYKRQVRTQLILSQFMGRKIGLSLAAHLQTIESQRSLHP